MDEVRDERETGFYQIDNEIIDEYAARIGVHALAVYNALARYSNKGRCFPSLSKLQKVLGVSRPTVVKAIEKLKEHKLIRTEQRSTGEAGHEVRQSTVYTLLRVKTGAHQVEGGSKGDLLPLVNAVDYGGKADLPGVVNDVYSNKTKGNKTKGTISGGDTDRLSAQDAAAVLASLGLDSELRRKILAARSDLTQAELDPWGVWLLNPPAWSDKPFAFCAKALVNRDSVPIERAKPNGKRSTSAVSEAPDYDIEEAKRRGAARRAQMNLEGIPEWA